MSAEHEISEILYAYVCRQAKSREVHAVAAKHGWTLNLRHWICNTIDAIDANGQFVTLRV